jgi:hypothetical protein
MFEGKSQFKISGIKERITLQWISKEMRCVCVFVCEREKGREIVYWSYLNRIGLSDGQLRTRQ